MEQAKTAKNETPPKAMWMGWPGGMYVSCSNCRDISERRYEVCLVCGAEMLNGWRQHHDH